MAIDLPTPTLLGPSIEGIDGSFGPAELSPPAVPLSPSAQPIVSQLDAVLRRPSLDETFLATIEPAIADLGILIPARYRELLDRSQTRLSELAQETASPALHRAAEVLHEVRQVRDLLDANRRALLQA